jgi:sterol 24-C-methyltransferase
MNFPPNSFDCVYAIEATVHAPSLQGVYEQIFRVLKPGGLFGVYEWVMTDKYDDSIPEHRTIRLGIERGDGIASMMTQSHAIEAIKAAGFELEYSEDFSLRPDSVPWWYPLAGEWKYARTLWDLFGVFRMSRIGRTAMTALLYTLELVRIAPSGTSETSNELAGAAESLVAGAKKGLFTPMFLMVGRKPAESS